MKLTLFLFMIFLGGITRAQVILTLNECHDRAASNYPLIKSRGLIEKTKLYSIENVVKGNLPQLSILGQATYQSEVTQVPVEMPGVEPLSKDQYRISGEISQTLYHGGVIAQRKAGEESKAEVEELELEVEMYQIKSRINDLYFGVLLSQEQIGQTQLIRKDIISGIDRVEASIANGTAIPSSADVLRAELLHVDQRILEMESAADSYRRILGLFINKSIGRETVFEKPSFATPSPEISRPELLFFDAQKRNLDGSEALLTASKKPRLELFLQAGYGRPGLNMLENEFDFFYLGGIRFAWQLSGYYTLKKEREILQLRMQSVDNRKETFLFNTGLVMDQQQAEVARLQKLIAIDDEIIALRSKVRVTAAVQLDEGVITSTDYVREVNAEDQAKQSRAIHEIQLLLAQAKYEFTAGQ